MNLLTVYVHRAYVSHMTTNWTHTATIARTYSVGPQQLGFTVKAGETVTIHEPVGNLVTFRYNNKTGVARVADLRNIEAK